MFRKGWVIYTLLITLASCHTKGGYYTIEGKILNNPSGKIYIYEAPRGSRTPVLLDSLKLKTDGTFTWTTAAKEESVIYLTAGAGQGSFAAVITDNKKIKVQADLSKQTNVSFTGSPASDQGLEFMKKIFVYLQEIYAWDQQNDSALNKMSIPENKRVALLADRRKIIVALKKYTVDFITAAKSPMLKIYAISNYQAFALNPDMSGFALDDFEAGELTEIINKAAAEFPDHQGLAAYKKTIEGMANRIAPDFTLSDINDKPVSLSSFRGKYVLVDFWASWCGPCRMENPNVVKAYQRFKNKNFTVLGVSLDKPGEKDKWLKAIRDDGLTWTQVSDLNYWNSSVVPLYGINGIPYNVLLNPEGKIIGENLRGEALEEKLAAVVK